MRLLIIISCSGKIGEFQEENFYNEVLHIISYERGNVTICYKMFTLFGKYIQRRIVRR